MPVRAPSWADTKLNWFSSKPRVAWLRAGDRWGVCAAPQPRCRPHWVTDSMSWSSLHSRGLQEWETSLPGNKEEQGSGGFAIFTSNQASKMTISTQAIIPMPAPPFKEAV
jgi:hypothetical protein